MPTSSPYRSKPLQLPVAIEGFPFVGLALFLALLCWRVGWVWSAWMMLGVAAFCVFFFRNPNRKVPQDEGLIVSPGDGRVLSVVDCPRAPISGLPAKKVSIFLSVFNVHMNRSPVTGTVAETSYRPGKFFVASLDKASEHNERLDVLIVDEQGRRYVVSQIAGLIARRIVSYCRSGDYLERGARIGLIRFGSRVELYLPMEAEVLLKAGDRVRGGETVVGRTG